MLPIFRTERSTLSPLGAAHLEACLAMDDDPEVMRFIPMRWHDRPSHRATLETRISHVYPAGMGYWAVLTKEEFLGWILLAPLDRAGPEIEIGWRFVRRAWGQGYATEAARAVLAYGLDSLGLGEIVADTDPANYRSMRVAERLGMTRVGPAVHAGYDVVRFIRRAKTLPTRPDSLSGRGSAHPETDGRRG